MAHRRRGSSGRCERDLVLNRVGDLTEAVEEIRRTGSREVGPDRGIAAGYIEPTPTTETCSR
jgi:hypothetical protein